MLNADRIPNFEKCPRCNDAGYQRFRTHSYCASCNYSNAYDSDELGAIPKWALDVLKSARKKQPPLVLPLNPGLEVLADQICQNHADTTEIEAS